MYLAMVRVPFFWSEYVPENPISERAYRVFQTNRNSFSNSRSVSVKWLKIESGAMYAS